MAPNMVIGLTGPFGSGCSEVAQILQSKRDYTVIRMSDILRREAVENQGLELPTGRAERRRLLTMVGRELRTSKGLDVLVKMALIEGSAASSDGPVVLDGIKNHHEAAAIASDTRGFVVAIDATDDTRWHRLEDEYEAGNRDLFDWDAEVDLDEGIEEGLSTRKCMELADVVIDNDFDWRDDDDRDEFASVVDDYMRLVEDPGSREPTVPEIHMAEAYWASRKSHCLSRKVGAVIVRQPTPEDDTEFLAEGHNHAPWRAGECVEVYHDCYRRTMREEKLEALSYCPRCRSEVSGGRCLNQRCEFWKGRRDILERSCTGRGLDLCRAVHAEEHAILRAISLTGTSLDGCTMYVTSHPCSWCAKSLVEVGIQHVVYDEAYPMPEAQVLLDAAEISRIRFEGVKGEGFQSVFPGFQNEHPNP